MPRCLEHGHEGSFHCGVGLAVGVSGAVAVMDAVGVDASVAVSVGVASRVGSSVGVGGSAASGVGVACTRKVSVLAVMNGSTLAPGTFTYHVESDEITG